MTTSRAAPAPSAMPYRTDIDGLRAIAVSLVLLFHFDLLPSAKAGFIGVDVFFVISGFLITTIITSQLDAGSFRIGSFYMRRIRRLGPALFVVLMLTLGVGWLLLFPSEFAQLARQAIYSQLYVANIFYWRNINYFDLSAAGSFLVHTWSLAVEEQFYLFFPLLMILVHKYARNHIRNVLLLGCILSFCLNVLLVTRNPEATFYLLPTRAWELLLGGLIPYLIKARSTSRAMEEWLGISGLILMLAGVFFYQEGTPFPGYFALFPCLATVAIIVGGHRQRTVVSKMMSLTAIAYIGKISYSLYLIHWPIRVFADLLVDELSLSWRLGMALLSVIIASTIYHLIEDPIRLRRFLPTSSALGTTYVAGLVISVLGCVAIIQTGGLPARFPEPVQILASYVDDKPPPLSECEFDRYSPHNACQIGVRQDPVTWMVWGDSHVWAAYAVFDQWLQLEKKTGLLTFRHACPPVQEIHLYDDTQDDCYAFNQSMMTFLAQDDSPKNVFLVSTWLQAPEGRLSTSNRIKLSSQQSVALFQTQLAATLQALRELGKNVYLWEPVPGARANVPISMANAELSGQSLDIEFTRDEYLARYDFLFTVQANQRDLIAKSFSPSQAVCTTGICAVAIAGKPLYFDDAHIRFSSTDFWVQAIQDQWSDRKPTDLTTGSTID